MRIFQKYRGMHYNLFLDDERNPGKDFPPGLSYVVRSYDEAIDYVNNYGLPAFISFDHDLGEEETGYDFAKWLVDYCIILDIKPTFNFYVHSQNPIGKTNIEELLNNFKEKFK